jgi:hypothetical protein
MSTDKSKNNTKEAIRFHEYAKSFFDIAIFYRKHSWFEKFTPAPYYLYCHSIELSLKSFLLTQDNQNLKTIKKINHDLTECIKELKVDTELTVEDKKIVKMANSYYNKKGFEYYDEKKSNGDYSLLAEIWCLDDLRKISKKLLNNFKK